MDVKWWIGIVENKHDPEYRGRVQVRILGIHTKQTTKLDDLGVGIPTEDLPWAICCMPLTFGGIAESTVAPPAVQPGAWVAGVSLDGDAYQKLLILGVISMALSPLSTHRGADLGLANSYQQTDKEDEEQSCKVIYSNAIKTLTSSTDTSLKANNMMIALEYLKQHEPQKYANFVKQSGVEISSDTVIAQGSTNERVNNLLAEGYYDYCLKVCDNDPVLAALAYSSGIGKAIKGYKGNQSYIQKYGDPRLNEISYEDLAKRINDESPSDAKFMKDFISKVGSDNMNRCVYNVSTSSPTENTQHTSSSGVTTSTETTTIGLSSIALPTNSNVITSIYMSQNRPEYGSKAHKGIDIRAYSGDPIRSMADGTVTALYPSWGGVLIDHGYGIKSRYLHMRKTYVKVGDKISVGQQIGESGNKGLPESTPHLHFEVWKNDTKIDPEQFLSENGIKTTRKAGA